MRRSAWLLVCLCVCTTAAWPATAIKKFSELKPGMKGIGKTVVRGFDIVSFDFEILDVLESAGFANDLLLIRCSGPVIDQTGGIAAGMSGSPLYIDNALVGAVAATTTMADTHVGYATPIEDMLKLWELGTPPVTVAAGANRLLPVGTPVLCSGVRGRALDAVGLVLRRYGCRALAADPKPMGPQPPAAVQPDQGLQAGSSLAASLTDGDVVLTALGTVTWRDGDRVLAFGHPFMQRGTTSLFLHQAYISAVVKSVELPFKIGSPAGEPVGVIVQDRSAGLAARIGPQADSFELEILARDETLKRERSFKVKVVQDAELAPSLVAVCVMQAMDEVRDRVGGGMARMSWQVAADGLDQPLARDDMIYSADDITGEALPGPLYSLDALLRNDFGTVTPRKVSVRVVTSEERSTVRLVGLTLNPARPVAGKELAVTARLQPYRGAIFEKTLTLTVPATATGRLVVDVHGRPEGVDSPLSEAALVSGGLTPPSSLVELRAALSEALRGNTLSAELLSLEAADERTRVIEQLRHLPVRDLFSDTATTFPVLGGGAAPSTRPLARAEATLDQVVQGRWREVVTVGQEP
ncbi:MAG: hypothetical protein HYU66_05350 [Armatimonadetes bacterium]|nr:hypothetical protein [Armatimonadota bacterium]